MCRRCADRILGREVPMMPAEFRHCYGVPGVNYAAHQQDLDGQTVDVMATFPDNAIGQQIASEYQEEFKDAPIRAVLNGQIILARKHDKDEP